MAELEWRVRLANMYPNNWIKGTPQQKWLQNFYVRGTGWQFNYKRETDIEGFSWTCFHIKIMHVYWWEAWEGDKDYGNLKAPQTYHGPKAHPEWKSAKNRRPFTYWENTASYVYMVTFLMVSKSWIILRCSGQCILCFFSFLFSPIMIY